MVPASSSLADRVDGILCQAGDPPYLDAIATALDHSIDAAALVYLDYLWQRRDLLPVLHPWAAAAYRELSRMPDASR